VKIVALEGDEPPRFLAATWEFGGAVSSIDVRFAP